MNFLILILVLVVVGTVGTAHAQKLTDIDMLVQIELRNSDGKLISYIEGKEILEISPVYLNQFLDGLPDKKIVTIDGKKFQLIQFDKRPEQFRTYHSYAMFALRIPINGEITPILLVNHDSYQTAPGDIIQPKFTVLRPVS